MIYKNCYATEKGHHCLLTCIRNYSKYVNCAMPETDLFLKIRGYDLIKLKFGIYGYNVVNSKILDLTRIPYDQIHFKKDQDLWKELSDLVRDEKKLITFLDAGKLKYSSAFAYATNIGHCVNVIGVNVNRQVYISDGYIATTKGSCFEGWIDFEEFEKAWEATGYGCVVIYPEKITKEWHDFPSDLRTVFANQKENNKKMLISIRHIVTKLKAVKQEERRQDGLRQFNNFMRISGLLFVREYFLELIKENGRDEELINRYAALLKEWGVVSCLIIKLLYVYDINEFDAILHKIEDIFAKENEIYEILI